MHVSASSMSKVALGALAGSVHSSAVAGCAGDFWPTGDPTTTAGGCSALADPAAPRQPAAALWGRAADCLGRGDAVAPERRGDGAAPERRGDGTAVLDDAAVLSVFRSGGAAAANDALLGALLGDRRPCIHCDGPAFALLGLLDGVLTRFELLMRVKTIATSVSRCATPAVK